MREYDFLIRLFNPSCRPTNQALMKEKVCNKGIKPHLVKVTPGRGVTSYSLFEFSNRTNSAWLPFFDNTYQTPGTPDAPKNLIALCDYIIVAECMEKTFVILVELKRFNDTAHAKEQLSAGKVFMEYFLATAERIKKKNGQDDFDSRTIEFRKVIVERVEKETLKNHQTDSNHNPMDFQTHRLIDTFTIRSSI